jgi:DNA-directed RNA polymerase specialized sigma24 family protein
LRLTQEAFDSLLAFLGPNAEAAAETYEEIRRRLLKIFTCRGCASPEDLVDDCIDRVAAKAAELKTRYEGDPRLYFYGVARRVFLESVKKRHKPVPPPPPDSGDEREQELECLDRCIEALPAEQAQFIRDYYRNEKGAKIQHRKELAERAGIEMNALRIRAHRIRARLSECVKVCVERARQASVPRALQCL